MSITPQLVFLAVGIMALVVAFALLLVALAYYARKNIRGVKNDLAGKARHGQRASSITCARTPRGTYARGVRHAAAPGVVAGVVREMPTVVAQGVEDDANTVLANQPRDEPRGFAGTNPSGRDANDAVPTILFPNGAFRHGGIDPASVPEQGAEDAPTLVAKGGEGIHAQADNPNVADALLAGTALGALPIRSDDVATAG